ncbi:MAG: hypothetical protein PHS93_07740 [Candidatus Omnitrophica bacterium]|nr:hypothetical protein [Candidatus Omnitrophota bacterium]
MTISRIEASWGSGAYATSDPRIPGVPTFVSNGTASLTFSCSANGNDAVVVYAFRAATYNFTTSTYHFQGYVSTTNGTVVATKCWQTIALWGDPCVKSLTDYVGYSFASKARNDAATPVESAYSASSAVMNTLPDIEYGVTSANLAREVTGGNTIVDDTWTNIVLSATLTGIAISGTQVASGEETQSVLPEYYGDITATYHLKNNYASTSRVIVKFSEDGTTWAAATAGTGGDGLTGLATTATGRQHVYVWDSYTDSGKSQLDTSVYLRIIPYDHSPAGGAAAASYTSAAFAVNNRPARITWSNSDTYSYDKDTTPIFEAIIPYLRGGTRGFPELNIYETSGMTLLRTEKLSEDVSGWTYESTLNTWVAATPAGIPDTAINGTNRMRYTVQAADAFAVKEYTLNGRMGETKDI